MQRRHTAKPPSWCLSTMMPEEMVCDKCGLYERTHLYPDLSVLTNSAPATNPGSKTRLRTTGVQDPLSWADANHGGGAPSRCCSISSNSFTNCSSVPVIDEPLFRRVESHQCRGSLPVWPPLLTPQRSSGNPHQEMYAPYRRFQS